MKEAYNGLLSKETYNGGLPSFNKLLSLMGDEEQKEVTAQHDDGMIALIRKAFNIKKESEEDKVAVAVGIKLQNSFGQYLKEGDKLIIERKGDELHFTIGEGDNIRNAYYNSESNEFVKKEPEKKKNNSTIINKSKNEEDALRKIIEINADQVSLGFKKISSLIDYKKTTTVKENDKMLTLLKRILGQSINGLESFSLLGEYLDAMLELDGYGKLQLNDILTIQRKFDGLYFDIQRKGSVLWERFYKENPDRFLKPTNKSTKVEHSDIMSEDEKKAYNSTYNAAALALDNAKEAKKKKADENKKKNAGKNKKNNVASFIIR